MIYGFASPDNGTSQTLTGWSSWAITNGYTSFPNATPAGKKMTMHLVYQVCRRNLLVHIVYKKIRRPSPV